METILFRGRKRFGGLVEGSLILSNNLLPIIVKINGKAVDTSSDNWVIDAPAFMVRPETVAQFTGLTDKSGNKIFGSIGVFSGGDKVLCVDSIIRDVIFYKGGFRLFSEGEECFWYTLRDSEEMEIIGNITDNPELLINQPK